MRFSRGSNARGESLERLNKLTAQRGAADTGSFDVDRDAVGFDINQIHRTTDIRKDLFRRLALAFVSTTGCDLARLHQFANV